MDAGFPGWRSLAGTRVGTQELGAGAGVGSKQQTVPWAVRRSPAGGVGTSRRGGRL